MSSLLFVDRENVSCWVLSPLGLQSMLIVTTEYFSTNSNDHHLLCMCDVRVFIMIMIELSNYHRPGRPVVVITWPEASNQWESFITVDTLF
jgi:hypothetical protein